MEIKWHDLDYNERTVKEFVEDKAGVYLILVELKNNGRKSIYVGKAEELKTRLLEHFSDSEPNTCLHDHIGKYKLSMIWAYITSEEDRKNIEYTLYKKYSPECNEKEPEGKLINFDFPKI